MSQCRSCGANIEFVETKSGRQMPMDVDASTCPTCNGLGDVFVFEKPVPCGKCDGEGELRLSHFATCPTAAQHRKKK